MRVFKKTAIAGGIGLAAYFLLVRPKLAGALVDSKEIEENFNRLPLKVHEFLKGIPLHSLDHIELKGGRDSMTVAEIYRAGGLSDLDKVELGMATKALFAMRSLIGKIMQWDDVPELVSSESYLPRLSDEERGRSLITPGEVRGISRVLYCFENEMVLEIINKTVHCFWVVASEPKPDGYALYNAVYVKYLNWRTPIYMAIISPVLKSVIYPAIGESIQRNWEREFPPRELRSETAADKDTMHSD